MTDLLIIALTGLVALILVRGIARRGGYLEYPFLAAAVIAGWVMPQILALRSDRVLPADAMLLLLTMVLLCLGAVLLGWAVGRAARPTSIDARPLAVDRLIVPVAMLTLFAIGMRVLIEMQPGTQRAMGGWSGPLTILAFFAGVSVLSLSLSLLLVLREWHWKTVTLAAINLALYVPPVLLAFRRAETLEVGIAGLAALWFVRRSALSAPAVVILVVAGSLFTFAVGELRSLTVDRGRYDIELRVPDLDEVLDVDFLGATPLEDPMRARELRNAAVIMGVTTSRDAFTYGAEAWNRLIHAYVPGQIVGVDFKRSLMVGTSIGELLYYEAGYRTHTGTTLTGFADAYRDFWFFGALVFFATAWVMGRLWALASAGSLWAQALYAALAVAALHAITHYSTYLFMSMPLILFATWLVWLAGRRPRAAGLARDTGATHDRLRPRRSGWRSPGST